MKKCLCLWVLLILAFYGTLKAQTSRQLQTLADKKEFFRLRTALQNNKSKLSTIDYLRFKAVTDNAFYKSDSSNADIETLFKNYSSQLTEKETADLLFIEQDNYIKLYNYKQASDICKKLLSHYSTVIGSDLLSEIQNRWKMMDAIKDVPPQQVVLPSQTTSIPWKRDTIGVMEIPVTCHNLSSNFIFDTGANFSTIQKNLAQKMGLKIIEASFDIEGSTGKENRSEVGIADSLYIGNILVRHAIFIVMPDEQLTIEAMNFSIKGIIGFPVMAQLKEIHFHQNGFITIPNKTTPGQLNNLALNSLTPVVNTITDNDTIELMLDSGANTSQFFGTYYNKYKSEVKKKGTAKKIKTGGVGGSTENKVYELDNFNLSVGNKKISLSEIDVQTASNGDENEMLYGQIGQDLISQFPEMVINFEDMYMEFK